MPIAAFLCLFHMLRAKIVTLCHIMSLPSNCVREGNGGSDHLCGKNIEKSNQLKDSRCPLWFYRLRSRRRRRQRDADDCHGDRRLLGDGLFVGARVDGAARVAGHRLWTSGAKELFSTGVICVSVLYLPRSILLSAFLFHVFNGITHLICTGPIRGWDIR